MNCNSAVNASFADARFKAGARLRQGCGSKPASPRSEEKIAVPAKGLCARTSKPLQLPIPASCAANTLNRDSDEHHPKIERAG
jgi:hypothetical protein